MELGGEGARGEEPKGALGVRPRSPLSSLSLARSPRAALSGFRAGCRTRVALTSRRRETYADPSLCNGRTIPRKKGDRRLEAPIRASSPPPWARRMRRARSRCTLLALSPAPPLVHRAPLTSALARRAWSAPRSVGREEFPDEMESWLRDALSASPFCRLCSVVVGRLCARSLAAARARGRGSVRRPSIAAAPRPPSPRERPRRRASLPLSPRSRQRLDGRRPGADGLAAVRPQAFASLHCDRIIRSWPSEARDRAYGARR